MDLSVLKEKFEAIFSRKATHQFLSPGRVNLIGEHIDYNGGYVFPCAITLGTYGLVAKRDDQTVRCYSLNIEGPGVISFDLDDLDYRAEDKWANYVKGMLKYIKEAGYNHIGGLDLLVYGNIPNGAGLSSSASLELLIGVIVSDLFDLKIPRLDLVKLGQRVENKFLGLNSGIMDQFAIGMGRKDQAIYLNVNTMDYEYVPAEFGDYLILIMNTNKRRELTDSNYNQRRAECEAALAQLQEKVDIDYLCDLTLEEFEPLAQGMDDPILVKRARHAISENDRTQAAKQVLKQGDYQAFGWLLNESHQSLKEDYEVTGVELDTLVEVAQACQGVMGARMTGAGMGGCAIALVRKDLADQAQATINERYLAKIGYPASFYLAEVGDGSRQVFQ